MTYGRAGSSPAFGTNNKSAPTRRVFCILSLFICSVLSFFFFGLGLFYARVVRWLAKALNYIEKIHLVERKRLTLHADVDIFPPLLMRGGAAW